MDGNKTEEGASRIRTRYRRKHKKSYNSVDEPLTKQRRLTRRSKKQPQKKNQQYHRHSPDCDSLSGKAEKCVMPEQTTEPQMNKSDNDDSDLEKEYMPHEWSTKFQTPEEVLHQYMQFIKTESEEATKSIPNELDVVYGPAKGQKLDIFGIDLPDDAPILLYIHGGYWKQISKDISRFPAVSMHKAGVKTFVIGYGQGRKVTLWDIVDQVEDAILYVLKYAEEKKSRGVYLAGHGSGAHLIAKVIGNSELFDCNIMKGLNGVYFISGLYDLRNFTYTSLNDRVNLEKIDEISFSPIFNNYNHLEHSSIRFYILAAEEDSSTFKRQARDFYDVLFDICPENMYLEIKDDVDHFEIVKCLTNSDNYLKNLLLHDLRKYLKD